MSYWYASPAGDNANDGTSFAKAKRNIQAAIDLAAPGETVRVHQGTYEESLTIDKPLEVVVYRPSKKWGQTLLVGPDSGTGLSVTGLAPGDEVRFIGLRMTGFETAIAGADNTGGTLTAYGVWCSPDISYGINPVGVDRVNAWSCVFEEQTAGLGGSAGMQVGIVSARGCTFYDCARSIYVGDAGILCRWRNCIMHDAGAAVRHVELDEIVSFEADYNLYGGPMPTTGYFLAGGVDYNSDQMYDSQWLAFQDLHSPPRNGDPGFMRTNILT